MLTFLDGPAEGKRGLCIRRAPLFLRVVQNGKGEWDCLDQLDDQPAVDERIWAYRLAHNDGMVHLNMQNRQGRHCGGFFVMATYRLCPEQPPEDVLRSTKAWQTWCLTRHKEETRA